MSGQVKSSEGMSFKLKVEQRVSPIRPVSCLTQQLTCVQMIEFTPGRPIRYLNVVSPDDPDDPFAVLTGRVHKKFVSGPDKQEVLVVLKEKDEREERLVPKDTLEVMNETEAEKKEWEEWEAAVAAAAAAAAAATS